MFQGQRFPVDREKEYTFTVLQATHDRFGNPQISLSLKTQNDRNLQKNSFGDGLFLQGVHLDKQKGVTAKHELEKLIMSFKKVKN
jgi:hypothetical protein